MELDGYKVGYGRPPLHTRFKRGESGHPEGRKRGSRSLSQLMARELDARVTVTENGGRRKITKREALAKKLVNDAIAGKLKPLEIVFGIDREAAVTLSHVTGALLKPEDESVKAELIRRLQAALAPEGDQASSPELGLAAVERQGG